MKATPTMQLVLMPTVTPPEQLVPIGAALFSSSQLKASHLSHVITNKDLPVKSAPDGHSCWSCWRLLYPLALLVHSNSLFCYLDGKDISALPLQEQNGGQQSPHSLLLFSWPVFLHFRLVFAQNLSCHCCIFIPLHLPGKLNQYIRTTQVSYYSDVKYKNLSLHWLWRKKPAAL